MEAPGIHIRPSLLVLDQESHDLPRETKQQRQGKEFPLPRVNIFEVQSYIFVMLEQADVQE